MQDALLKQHKLSVTESRLSILSLFEQSPNALSQADIEAGTASTLDRVTVYRTLQTFLQKGLIHQVPTADAVQLYALCGGSCSTGHHSDDHVHFECTTCLKTTCLDDVIIPTVKLPRGFKPSRSSMIVEGTCAACKA